MQPESLRTGPAESDCTRSGPRLERRYPAVTGDEAGNVKRLQAVRVDSVRAGSGTEFTLDAASRG